MVRTFSFRSGGIYTRRVERSGKKNNFTECCKREMLLVVELSHTLSAKSENNARGHKNLDNFA
jgi:hypothetical protein